VNKPGSVKNTYHGRRNMHEAC